MKKIRINAKFFNKINKNNFNYYNIASYYLIQKYASRVKNVF